MPCVTALEARLPLRRLLYLSLDRRGFCGCLAFGSLVFLLGGPPVLNRVVEASPWLVVVERKFLLVIFLVWDAHKFSLRRVASVIASAQVLGAS